MDPTKENTELDKIQEQFNTNMLNNPGACTGTISTGLCEDTITLSSYPWSNTSITNTSITGGGYTVSPNVTLNGGLYSTGTVSQPWFSNSAAPKIKLDGEGADIEVNGWSLIDAIQKIEERLNILHPNEKLEEEWNELRELGNKYRELEQHIKDKQATWDRLKAMPTPTIE